MFIPQSCRVMFHKLSMVIWVASINQFLFKSKFLKYISVVGHMRVYEIQSTLCVPHRPISSSHASGQNHNLTSHIFLNLPSSAFILSSNEKVPTFLQKVSPPPPVYFISCAPRKSHFWENHISSFCQKYLKSKTFLVRDTQS